MTRAAVRGEDQVVGADESAGGGEVGKNPVGEDDTARHGLVGADSKVS